MKSNSAFSFPGIVVALLLIFWSYSLQSQDFVAHNVQLGEEIKESRTSHILGVVPGMGATFYVLRVRNAETPQIEYWLDRISQDLENTQTQQLDFQEKKEKRKLEEVLGFGDGPLLFSSKEDYRLKRLELYSHKVDPESLTLSPPEKLVEVPLISRQEKTEFNFRVSPDSSKLMVYYDLPFQKAEKERFGYLIFDRDLNLLEKREIKLPYNDELFQIDQYKVDNDGNTYVSGILFHEKVQEKRRGKANYKHLVLAYERGVSRARQYVMKLEGKFITDLKFSINTENDLICCGFFSEKGTSSIIGAYFLHVDGKTGKVIRTSQKEFNPDFLANFMSEKKVAKGRELFKYQLNDLYLTSSGRTLLLAEQYYVTAQNYSSSDRFGVLINRSSFTYHYKDIIVLSMDEQGETEWAIDIPKIQITTDDGGAYSSYAFTVRDERLWLLYNDDPRNAEFKEEKVFRFSNEPNSSLTQVLVNEKGDWAKQKVVDFKKFGMPVQARYCEVLEDGRWIIFGSRGRKKRYGTVETIDLLLPEKE